MNYFGHAALATLHSDSPAFVLGSMLPDLCAMVGEPCEPGAYPELNAGLNFHLTTDSVFHQTAMFLDHNRRVLQSFREMGISRGPARACSHMGVEMLIDATLVNSGQYLSHYAQALAFGISELSAMRKSPLSRAWSLGARLKLKGLFSHLADRGSSIFAPSYSRFHERFSGALSHRRRLAPTAQELAEIARFLEEDLMVGPDVPHLLAEMAERLQSAQLSRPAPTLFPAARLT